jgi:hypothetical protein
MENIIKYNEFLNEKQLEFPFMDEAKMEEQRAAQMKLFKKGIYSMEQLDLFLSMEPTRAEINDAKAQLIGELENFRALLKENDKLEKDGQGLMPEIVKKIKEKAIPAMEKMIAAIKKH